jgi:hypothetical protein
VSRNPSIGSIPPDVAPSLRTLLAAMKEAIEVRNGQRGDALDQGVTLRMLVGLEGLQINLNGPGGGNPSLGWTSPDRDLAEPPALTNLEAVGALATIIVSWQIPAYGNHSHTEIWRSDTNNLGTASMIGMTPGKVYADAVGGGRTCYYWVRAVSTANKPGPYNAVSGVQGQTSLDPGYVMDLLTGDSTTPFVIQAEPTVINGYPVPAGTYIRDAFIKVGTIGRAMIGLAAIDDARIANLSAEKITAGFIDVARIQVGTLTGDRLAARTITADRIVANAITATEIAADAITASELAAGAVTTAKLTAGAVTADKISVSSLAAISANIGAVTAGSLAIYNDGGAGYGYVRSASKWWGDGVAGWALGRHNNGDCFFDVKGGSSRLWVSSWGDCGISFPNFSVDNNGNLYARGDILASSVTAGIITADHIVGRGISEMAYRAPSGDLWFSFSYDCLVLFGGVGGANPGGGGVSLYTAGGSLIYGAHVGAGYYDAGGSWAGFADTFGGGAAWLSPGSYFVRGVNASSLFALWWKR